MDETTHVQQEAGLLMCGAACSGAGHRLHPIQRSVAAGAPSAWRDALAHADEQVLDLVGLDGQPVRLWHHLPFEVEQGEPVAYHPVAGVVAIRGALLNVRVLSA